MKRLLGRVLWMFWLPIAAIAGQNAIVDAEFVAQALARGAIVWDVRSQDEYRRGHLPGAVNIDDIQNVLRDPAAEDYIVVEEIGRKLGEAGIDPAREIVLYGSKAHTGPYFGYMTLRWMGARTVHVYHGGIEDWKSGNRPLATDTVRLAPVAFKTAQDPSLIVSTQDVLARIGQPGVQILDVRTAANSRAPMCGHCAAGMCPAPSTSRTNPIGSILKRSASLLASRSPRRTG
jgi:thiosulfate/3-mercaptopyruvate sulfurtransferase